MPHAGAGEARNRDETHDAAKRLAKRALDAAARAADRPMMQRKTNVRDRRFGGFRGLSHALASLIARQALACLPLPRFKKAPRTSFPKFHAALPAVAFDRLPPASLCPLACQLWPPDCNHAPAISTACAAWGKWASGHARGPARFPPIDQRRLAEAAGRDGARRRQQQTREQSGAGRASTEPVDDASLAKVSLRLASRRRLVDESTRRAILRLRAQAKRAKAVPAPNRRRTPPGL